MKLRLTLPALTLAAACGGNLADELDPGPMQVTDEHVKVTDLGEGAYELVIDSTAEDSFVYLDLETNRQVTEVTVPEDHDGWDLAFRRFNVKVNGGSSGRGNVEVSALAGVAFEDVTAAPRDGWGTDRPDEREINPPEFVTSERADLVFRRGNTSSENGWFEYDPTWHTVSPADVTYVVHTRNNRYFKLRFDAYYDEAGSPAILTMRVAEVTGPEQASGQIVDANSKVYLSLSDGVVTVSDPATSLDWDLAIDGVGFSTNSGTSGSGQGGAKWALESSVYSALQTATTLGFEVDEELPVPGPPGPNTFSGNPVLAGWYDYDPSTHAVTPKPGVLIVRGARGAYGKLSIISYAEGVYELQLAPLEVKVESARLDITLSSSTSWTAVDLRRGLVLGAEDTEGSWDFAVQGRLMRTNGGTSGDGNAGVLLAETTRFDRMDVAPTEGYTADEMRAWPEHTVSATVSANPVLSEWYDLDVDTDEISVADKVFGLRLADGTYAKLEFTGLAEGVLSIHWVYAGPERTALEPE